MTDHSILNTGLPELPLREEAGAVTRFTDAVRYIFVDLPAAFRAALATRDLFDELTLMDAPQLAALGVRDRNGIARYAARRTGLIDEPARD